MDYKLGSVGGEGSHSIQIPQGFHNTRWNLKSLMIITI